MESRRLGRAPNGSRASEVERWVETTLDGSMHFTPGFLRDHGWLVVPVESGLHLDESDAKCISRAASLCGKTKLRAVLLEELKEARNHLEVDATVEGLLLFSRECAHFNYALLPEDYSFAVICTTSDYFLVAGSRRFVKAATGKEIAAARSDFEEYASDDSWSDSDRARLVEVSRRYEEA